MHANVAKTRNTCQAVLQSISLLCYLVAMISGKQLRALREARQISVADLARKLGTSRQHIYMVENGKHGMTIRRLEKVAKILSVSIGELLNANGR
jgi:transcriptional regulator with XRE-family HTH domain